MRKYEIMVIFSGKTEENKLKDLTKTFEDKLLANDAKLAKKDELGLKDFAYEIKKESKGYYNVYYVETNSDNIDEINRYYRITSDVLRLMVIKHEDQWPYDMNKNIKNPFPVKPTRKNYKRKFDGNSKPRPSETNNKEVKTDETKETN